MVQCTVHKSCGGAWKASSTPAHSCPLLLIPPTLPLPFEQCRLQLGGTERYHSYSGPIDCLRQTVRSEGWRGLTRGLGGTMARECPGNAVCECPLDIHSRRQLAALPDFQCGRFIAD